MASDLRPSKTAKAEPAETIPPRILSKSGSTGETRWAHHPAVPTGRNICHL